MKESCCVKTWRLFSYVWSTAILLFCSFILLVELVRGWTDSRLPAVANIIEVLFLLIWMALLEGAFTSIAGLKQTNPDVYRVSHPRAYTIMHSIQKGNNRERFIVGRQLLLMFLVFFVTQACGGKERISSHNVTAQSEFYNPGLGDGVLGDGVLGDGVLGDGGLGDGGLGDGVGDAEKVTQEVESFSIWGWQWYNRPLPHIHHLPHVFDPPHTPPPACV